MKRKRGDAKRLPVFQTKLVLRRKAVVPTQFPYCCGQSGAFGEGCLRVGDWPLRERPKSAIRIQKDAIRGLEFDRPSSELLTYSGRPSAVAGVYSSLGPIFVAAPGLDLLCKAADSSQGAKLPPGNTARKNQRSTIPLRILIVEDEEKMAKALRTGFEADQFSVSVARTGEEGFFLASTETFDLVILDLMLPGRDGMQVLAALRQKGSPVPVLILTSKDTVKDRVRGLDAGADDYMVKPFAFSELLARIRALLRRGKSELGDRIRLADLDMDTAAHVVSRSGRELTLTAREFDLLEYLLRQQGRVVSREMLARDVWKETARYTPLDNVIDVHIAHLRRKVDEPFTKKLLHTVRGVGFVLREETP